jgi:putative SOS response-associated peptidase YedK
LCGRFTLRTPPDQWCQLFLPELSPAEIPFDGVARYNIAPTQSIVAILREATGQDRTAAKFRWGLVPSWADDLAIGNRMINARGETVDTKPSFRKAFATRRCLILADGYYEWKKVADGKQPYLIEQPDHGMLAMAGLWEVNRKIADDGSAIETCTIITTSANGVTGEIHQRMPVFLDAAVHDQWLDPGYRDTEKLKELLVPAPDDCLQLTAVSRRVNSPKHDDPDCIQPLES